MSFTTVVLFGLSLPACHTTDDKLRVLEKSRQLEPSWVKQGVGLKLSEEGIDYVILKDKVLDLPLGLRQAESSVLYNLKFHMYGMILSHIDTSQLNDDALIQLRRHLSSLLDKELGKPNLKDFYFDKISVPQAENELIPEYYRIFAHARVEPKQRTELTEKIKTYIRTSSHTSLKPQLETIQNF